MSNLNNKGAQKMTELVLPYPKLNRRRVIESAVYVQHFVNFDKREGVLTRHLAVVEMYAPITGVRHMRYPEMIEACQQLRMGSNCRQAHSPC